MEPACGRPLGLSFEKKSGDLYFCDGYLGVMKVGPNGGLAEKVVDEVEGQKIMFANQMDIDEEDDAIYFNDSSDTYHFGYYNFTSILLPLIIYLIRESNLGCLLTFSLKCLQ